MFRRTLSRRLSDRPRSTRAAPRFRLSAAILAGALLAACSSGPPPNMDTVKKLVAEDRTFDALATLIPLAQKGDPEAQYELAGFYHYGYVGANDYGKALKWYRASARQGYADAMVGLSVMYLGGQGVLKDRREAFVWLNLAAQYMADKKAVVKIKAVRDEIGNTLTKDDIAFAKAETILLQPETTSVQPNEAESIDHLPDTVAPQTAPAAGEPLQNVPPDTGPVTSVPTVPDIELEGTPPPAPAAAAKPVTTMPATTMPATTSPAAPSAEPTTITIAPAPPTVPAKPKLPMTTAPATPLPLQTPASSAPIVPPAQGLPESGTSDGGSGGNTSPPVDSVPQF